ncbi:MAG: galactose-1-phosphate uridylyltransferase [Armatimonadota bacterium]
MPAHGRRDSDFQPELRKNVVTREWVIIAKGRGSRPSDFAHQSGEGPALPARDESCPFCPGNEDMTPPEVFSIRRPGAAKTGQWQVRVVPNKYAALRPDAPDVQRQVGIHSWRDGHGAHEVVVESPRHNKDLWELSDPDVQSVIEAYRQRYLAFESVDSLQHVLVFRNRGAAAGTSLAHPHSQLIASPVVSRHMQTELEGAAAFWEYLGQCVFCALIKDEAKHGERVVAESEHFMVVAAYAGRYPFETWILPKQHSIRFAAITEDQVTDLGRVLKDALRRIAVTLNRPSYNFAIHTALPTEHNVRAYHWHIEVFPRLTTPGGFELGSDVYINTVAPEDAAQILRSADAPPALSGTTAPQTRQ